MAKRRVLLVSRLAADRALPRLAEDPCTLFLQPQKFVLAHLSPPTLHRVPRPGLPSVRARNPAQLRLALRTNHRAQGPQPRPCAKPAALKPAAFLAKNRQILDTGNAPQKRGEGVDGQGST